MIRSKIPGGKPPDSGINVQTHSPAGCALGTAPQTSEPQKRSFPQKQTSSAAHNLHINLFQYKTSKNDAKRLGTSNGCVVYGGVPHKVHPPSGNKIDKYNINKHLCRTTRESHNHGRLWRVPAPTSPHRSPTAQWFLRQAQQGAREVGALWSSSAKCRAEKKKKKKKTLKQGIQQNSQLTGLHNPSQTRPAQTTCLQSARDSEFVMPSLTGGKKKNITNILLLIYIILYI